MQRDVLGPEDIGPGLFVTGTDTGVGKTFVTAAITRLLRQQRRPVRVCKPVASGARWIGERLLSDDTVALASAAGMVDGLEQVTPWAFPDPVAPPVAARRRGVALSLPSVAQAVHVLRDRGTAVLVEGVGGLLCPLTEHEAVADLALALRFPVLVVTRRSLGTLNHTLLTLEAARTRGLCIAGVVVNETTPPCSLAEETNVAELQQRLDAPLLAVIPYQANGGHGVVAALSTVDWWRLCHLITRP